jgi:CubicO group peptidase (beta-lactamase class C family)
MHHARRILLTLCGIGLAVSCTSTATTAPTATPLTSAGSPAGTTSAGTVPSADPAQEAAITKLITDEMAARHLRSVIVKVSVDGKPITTQAFGESMTGVPATTAMHFRNGAVAISYVATLLLMLVDQKVVSLDDKVSKWLPDVPHANEVTLGQLARMTSGIHDYVIGNDELDKELATDPFRQYSPEDLVDMVKDDPLWFTPGTNWSYAHTNFVILGLALEKITGKPMAEVLQERVLGPLGLTNTTDPASPAIPEPALHAFTSERRKFLGVPAGTPFYEESTYWNPSWTITRGAIETTNIDDLHATAIAIGTGKLLSPDSYKLMVSTDLRGTSKPVDGCVTCIPQQDAYSYGVGLVTSGNWLLQNPQFSGESGSFAYLPSQKIAIAVAVTLDQAAFDADGLHSVNDADALWREIGKLLAPNDPPPIKG